MPRKVLVKYFVYETPEVLATAAARLFTERVAGAIAQRGVARLAISGGTTPKRMFQLLADAEQPFHTQIDWARLHLYWVDERSVGPEDAESNYRMTREALLAKVPIPAENVHRMEGELPPEEAAARYETVLRNSMRLEGAESPAFDLLLLGMGDDGHTASIFPHTEAVHNFGHLVIANEVPQKETWRITLTWSVINAAKDVAFLIEGAGKAERLKQVLLGKYDPETLPSQLIRPTNGRLTYLLDAAAAELLPAAAAVEDDAHVGQLELS
jgi:6-phosphogluconolactonase